MGRARTRLDRFREQHPYCCFCGGDALTESIDHVPSRQTFLGRKRPQGLEMPACKRCNSSTGTHELVAALMGRMWPDLGPGPEQEETARLMQDVHRQRPGLLEELLLPNAAETLQELARTIRGMTGEGGVFRANGPLLNESMAVFGVKLGCALHYHTTGIVVPRSGGVSTRWFSNVDAFQGSIPPSFLEILGPPQTLRQGRWEVSDQFQYASAVVPNGAAAAYFATLRLSFAVAMFVRLDRSGFPLIDGMPVYPPAFWLGLADEVHLPG